MHDAAFGQAGASRIIDAIRQAGHSKISLVVLGGSEVVGHILFAGGCRVAGIRRAGHGSWPLKPPARHREASMNDTLRTELIQMDDHDQTVRAELAAEGSLFDGYHPRMAAVHDANAARLKAIIAEHGWPTEQLVGVDGAKAAHRIAQHSINHPGFMRECRMLLDDASARGEVPRWQFAYIDDRIRVYEGLPQRYGTQWRGAPDGLEPYPLEDPAGVDARRAELGLPPLARLRSSAPTKQDWDAEAARRYEAREIAWRRAVGWMP